MVNKLKIECVGEPETPIPESVYLKTKVKAEDAFSKADAIIKVAKEIKNMNGDCFCKVPFCVTVEAEAMGVHTVFSKAYGVPVVDQYRYNSLEEIESIDDIALDKGRISEVLSAIEKLTQEGETVICNIEGPLTILGLLLSSRHIYKGLLKNPDKIMEVSRQIIQKVILYAKEAVRRGAKIISYADPTVSYDLVSNKVYEEVCGKASYEFLKQLQEEINGCLIHLCNRTSVGFEKAGFCTSKPIQVPANITYGQALKSMISASKTRFIGHGCLQQSAYPMKDHYIYELQLG